MTRTSFRPMASVGLVAAVLIYVGCSQKYETVEKTPVIASASLADAKPIPPQSAAPAPAPTPPPGPKLIADWSARPPAAILLISGEQDGYPDPCGCTEGQLGGLGRRYDFVEKLEAKGWPMVKVDLGNLIHYRANSRGGDAQEKIKFNVIHQALSAMKYDAVALGPEDLKPSVLDTLGALLNFQEPKFLAANVKASDPGLGEAFRPTRIASAGRMKIGITAVLDPASYQMIQDANANLLEVKPPDDVLAATLEDLSKQTQIQVLMVQGPHEEARRLAEKFPGFEVVIGTSENADPDERAHFLHGGKTLLVDNIGQKGKHVGVIGFFPAGEQRMVFRRQSLGKDFVQAEPMRILIDQEYQAMLKQEGVVENIARSTNGQSPGATYVGALTCQACHPKTFEKWASTKHARAYEPLVNPRRNREYDAECISCHTTGFGYHTGWVSAEKTPLLKGNQCENCHGPGSLHIADPDNLAFRKPMAMTAEMAEKNGFCNKCHDDENDPKFKFPERYAQIFHKGFDSYEDPKVHQKQPR